ncbi:Protein CBG28045 [Caenorhabditis briggsae]|uniref:Uncharacterized protein n=2 Tax=Caenorhabditis briggsae TaxID=6238 RepID=A0AAE9CXF8_CAEBR|nr:Protein CBG28045 [Caenorhabditis briggsae]ULT84514.1 hypothetical protein L3Y34_013288 [Caenorhabditis briggsae]UMM43759.1 hypothetical protein L5515_019133 [Caenorhabditis briggsae]CAR99065.1 Protein CBG28045 [Caenorhabditis briggsae]
MNTYSVYCRQNLRERFLPAYSSGVSSLLYKVPTTNRDHLDHQIPYPKVHLTFRDKVPQTVNVSEDVEKDRILLAIDGTYSLDTEMHLPSSSTSTILYNGLENINICIDTRRPKPVRTEQFLHRSCNPTCYLHHSVNQYKELKVFVLAKKNLRSLEPVTLPFSTFLNSPNSREVVCLEHGNNRDECEGLLRRLAAEQAQRDRFLSAHHSRPVEMTTSKRRNMFSEAQEEDEAFKRARESYYS